MISEQTDLHAYCVQRLYLALQEDIAQQPLTQVGVWTIGELGDLLITGQLEEEERIDVRDSNHILFAQDIRVAIGSKKLRELPF